MKNTASALLASVLLTACASTYNPIIDKRGVNQQAYEQDLAECREYASEVSVSKGVAKGAAVGAAVGAAAGAISGNVDRGAGYGSLSGGVRSGIKNVNDKSSVVKRCLSGRGYRVLN